MSVHLHVELYVTSVETLFCELEDEKQNKMLKLMASKCRDDWPDWSEFELGLCSAAGHRSGHVWNSAWTSGPEDLWTCGPGTDKRTDSQGLEAFAIVIVFVWHLRAQMQLHELL